MEKILVLGPCGSGKTTLAKKLAYLLDIELIHLDSLFWRPGWKEPDLKEWICINENLSERDRWIMDGNYCRTLDIRLRKADLVIYLDIPFYLCMYRVLIRTIRNLGRNRSDVAPGCFDRFNRLFFISLFRYEYSTKPIISRKIVAHGLHQKTVVIRRPADINALLQTLEIRHVSQSV